MFHCIFMIYPWTANGMSWCSLYLWETRESGDERKEQKQENRLIDLIWILLSAVWVMMMMGIPVRIQASSHTLTHSAVAVNATHLKCAHKHINTYILIRYHLECRNRSRWVHLQTLISAHTICSGAHTGDQDTPTIK